jgi:hypothetical protein
VDLVKILGELRLEREQIDEAMATLERLARRREPKPGRPPAWISAITKKRRGRPPGTKNLRKMAPESDVESRTMPNIGADRLL